MLFTEGLLFTPVTAGFVAAGLPAAGLVVPGFVATGRAAGGVDGDSGAVFSGLEAGDAYTSSLAAVGSWR